jgi:hypothetical protein
MDAFEEPNPIVLNTGPHWQRFVMGRETLSASDFEQAFQKMVDCAWCLANP